MSSDNTDYKCGCFPKTYRTKLFEKSSTDILALRTHGEAMEILKFLFYYILVCIGIQPALGEPGWFWHVTDFHYDFTYNDRQLSCRGKNLTDPGKYGDYWCDSPWSLINSSVYAMATLKPDVDFIIWTGDTVLHGKDPDLSLDINSDILKNITNLLKTAFPQRPVFSAYGNHDYWPSDQFPAGNNELYNRTLAEWRSWINDTNQEINFLKGGYYTLLIQTAPKIRILSLNTNLYYTSNKVTPSYIDPAGQFQWMESVLNSSRELQEKVIVIAHIPPGVHTPDVVVWMYDQFNNRLNELFLKYSDVIVAMHFGHDHADGFKVYLDKAGEPVIPVFIAPSVTPWRYKPEHNPAIRLVNYDRQTGKHLDINQYYLDLPEANAQKTATWKLGYTAKQQYGVMDLTPSSLLTLMNKMKDYGTNEFQNYFKWTTVNASSTETCNTDCHVSILCGFSNFDITSYNNCKSKTNMNGSTSRKGYLFIPLVFLIIFLQILCI